MSDRRLKDIESIFTELIVKFIIIEEIIHIKKCTEKGVSVISNDIASHHETYTIFNREYPWSPSCKQFEEYAWVNAHHYRFKSAKSRGQVGGDR